MERLPYAKRYTSKEVWKRDGKARFGGRLTWAGQDDLDGSGSVV